ncbi:D-glycerate dehydrogenase [Paenibacillus sp. J22TS3]|uniref:2-hydroxyacid dehydrogenase n=1 Tax=Paenibacillus sp. J22TS3 TaxID=2807192 RepID=UPI001B08D4B3|nr:D-glycerate dehydrogenase [Paenibacillus sp. J22TS3]GIP22534.1 bifunctional glyoxylate/hydroxypyruvate reductase B [Paenibacillus sp. J22TS3]
MTTTTKPKIFIARPIPPEVEQYLARHCTYTKWSGDKPASLEEIIEHISDVDGLLTTGGRINAELLDHAPNLKVVSTMSVGYNNFDIEEMKRRGIKGTNTPDVLNDTVADLILSLMLSVARRVPEMDKYIREGNWKRGDNESLFGLDVHHKTLGIIGMGSIGRVVAHRAKHGFGMDILYHNRHRSKQAEQDYGAVYSSMDELLGSSDFIVLMTPLTEETRHMIGEAEFAKMKRTAIFINASRGQTVDEEALIQALQNGVIYGAGLDVFEKEPIDPSNPLLKMSNVVLLPHIGSATEKTRTDMAMRAAENLVRVLQGESPAGLVKELRDI